jgi:hypothetical protein
MKVACGAPRLKLLNLWRLLPSAAFNPKSPHNPSFLLASLSCPRPSTGGLLGTLHELNEFVGVVTLNWRMAMVAIANSPKTSQNSPPDVHESAIPLEQSLIF